MTTIDTRNQPTEEAESGDTRRWPEWVIKELDQIDPLVVDGVGTATNSENDHVILVLTSDDEELQLFEISKPLTRQMVKLLSRLL